MSITDGKAVAGRTTAITVLTPIKVGATPLLRAVFWIGDHVKMLNKALEDLSFIHYARWSIITGLPDNGPAQPKDVLNHDYLFFQTNFNGTWDEYIDAFSEVVPRRMTAIWGTSYGFPGPQPVGPFKEYIHRNDLDIQHYYAAYPEATTTEVISALELGRRFDAFRDRVGDVGPDEFQRAYIAFLTDVQQLL